ncbi:PAQR family membrane homeostasis protein TrhA [Paracoccus actinidiae]|uniref:PAQR family membrane homeostasis protein TrhA n=1 Tax=Paracoccus actinidiae TaxID=3064531 RepID=UPI0027D3395B|nr:hemolysin III family protein [Paracoccus sp. M09]
MITRLPQRAGYSRTENISDFIVHAVGLLAALMAVPILIIHTWSLGTEPAVLLGVAIYGVALIAMILCSTLYNMAHPDVWSGVLRRLDHSAIYVKIAGTYTPFALLSPGPTGWFLIWIWACAALGAALRSFTQDHFRGVAIGLYLVMGWSGVVAGGAVFAEMTSQVFALILGGGLLYTSGFAFYLSPRLPYHRTIWHLFVIAASAVFFAAVAAHVLGSAGST